jgi:hypothetical protein
VISLKCRTIVRRMNFRGGLLSKEHPSSPFDPNRAGHFITTEEPRCALHQDQMSGGPAGIQNSRYLERYFAVSMSQDGSPVLEREGQLQTPTPAYICERSSHGLFEQQFLPDPGDNTIDSFACFKVSEDERLGTAHQFGVPVHYRQIRADMWRQIRLVDHQQV